MTRDNALTLVAAAAILVLLATLVWIWWPRLKNLHLFQPSDASLFDMYQHAITRPAPTWETWVPDWFAFPKLWRDPWDDKLEQQAIDRTWADYEGWPHRVD